MSATDLADPPARDSWADDELFVDRVFDAPLALVWRLWEDNSHRLRWWGPKDFETRASESDFREGGAWRACIHSEQYGTNWHGGVYREIRPMTRIVFTFAWDEGSGPTNPTLITVTFSEKDGKTHQRFHQTGLRDVATRDSHTGGWNSFMDREAGYLEEISQ